MSNPSFLPPLVGLTLALCGLWFLVRGMRSATATEINARLREFVEAADVPRAIERTPETRFRRSELSGTFWSRVVLPRLRSLVHFLGRYTPAAALDDVRTQLAQAGNPLGLGPAEFFGIRVLFLVIGIWVAFLFVQNGLTSEPSANPRGQTRVPPHVLGVGAGLFSLYAVSRLPQVWLRRRIRTRQDRIRRNLPDALDMLSVCANAGLGFDQALLRVSERWDSPLAAEFGRVVKEIGMGRSRARAMRDLSDRAGVPELASFVAVILQSEQLGMSIAQTLHAQAEQMRVERRFRAQEEARKAPLKMLFPMMLLIFPAMFAVILGPTVPIFIEFFSNLRRGG